MKISQFLLSLAIVIPSYCFSQESRELSLEDLFGSTRLVAKSVKGIHHMEDGKSYARFHRDSLNIYSYRSGDRLRTLFTSQNLIPEGDTSPIEVQDFSFSADERKVLLATETESIYRHSSISQYYVFDVDNSTLFPVSDKGKQQLATFSPDGRNLAFVRDNNLFLMDIAKKKVIRVTNDGEKNKVINGAPDWVYEEEFGFAKAFAWSPDGKKIAFYRFDESDVSEFPMMIWGSLYPEENRYKYPKAGERNSTVTIHVYDLESGRITKMDTGDEEDIYIPRMKWTSNPDELAIQWLNRRQSEMKVLIANASDGTTNAIYSESNKYYIEITDDLIFLGNNNNFLLTSEQDGYNHIYLFDMLGNLERQITKGSWDVDRIVGIDEKKGRVYYISAESSPLNRELYSIKVDGTDKKCISGIGGTHSINFGKGWKYFIDTYSDANTPPLITLKDSNGKTIRTLEENEQLANAIKDFDIPAIEFFSFETSEGVTLNGSMIKPSDFDPQKKYPVLMHVYGGPGSQTVRNAWGRRSLWHMMIATKGIIVVSVDNRGTGFRGEEFKKMTYLQLGKFETIDQIETASHLGTLPYVDPDRIGIWGWSYGGFMTLSCLMLGNKEFCMGAAVAPVTNWRYYDNIYTERFMRTPRENPEGYDQNSPINHVEKLRGELLIIHGTADDNVHLQNSMDLITALVKADKQFEMQFYPNSNHGIYTGQNTTMHLYERLTDFILSNLLKKGD